MRAYRYVKISRENAEKLGLLHRRNSTSDGGVIINESDVMNYAEGDTFEDKVDALGGRVLSNTEARQELKK